jgi:hypothetical protein
VGSVLPPHIARFNQSHVALLGEHRGLKDEARLSPFLLLFHIAVGRAGAVFRGPHESTDKSCLIFLAPGHQPLGHFSGRGDHPTFFFH